MGLCASKDADANIIQLTTIRHSTYLIGDIGGTNARFIFKKANKSVQESEAFKEVVLETKKYQTLIDCLKAALEGIDRALYPTVFCMGIAGPTKGDTIKITNAQWPEFNPEHVREEMKFQHIKILNDFEANGYGVLAMDNTHYIQINKAPVVAGAPKALIGAGTGLGECVLTKSSKCKNYDIYPCEGGHTDFAPRTDLEFGFMMHIKESLNLDRVSVERCVSGPAIPLLYEYLRNTLTDLESPLYAKNNKPENKEIIDAGKDKKDPVCEKVVDSFLSMYGAEAGNLALKVLPFGGVYLLSGITQTLKDKIIKEDIFMNNFLKKGRMRTLLEKVPIFIADDSIGLIGAEEAALRFIKSD